MHCKKRLAIFPSPELIVLVDFEAIYPGVPPGIFASFPGVAHFLSFEDPRDIKIPGVHLTFLKHLNITNFLNEQYLVFYVPSHSYFLILLSYTSYLSLIILYFLFFSSYSSHIILLLLSSYILNCMFYYRHAY